jgi:hypothetical protein
MAEFVAQDASLSVRFRPKADIRQGKENPAIFSDYRIQRTVKSSPIA